MEYPDLEVETFYRQYQLDMVVSAEMIASSDVGVKWVEDEVRKSLAGYLLVSISWERINPLQYVCHGTGWKRTTSLSKDSRNRIDLPVINNKTMR